MSKNITAQERLFDLGFEKVAKHKFVKVNKGGSGYNTPYKITIEFAFNMYQVKCECENWLGVDLELSKVLVDYLKELENEKIVIWVLDVVGGYKIYMGVEESAKRTVGEWSHQ